MNGPNRRGTSFHPGSVELEKLAGASAFAPIGFSAVAIAMVEQPVAGDIDTFFTPAKQEGAPQVSSVPPLQSERSVAFAPHPETITASTRSVIRAVPSSNDPVSPGLAPENQTVGGLIRPLRLAPSANQSASSKAHFPQSIDAGNRLGGPGPA